MAFFHRFKNPVGAPCPFGPLVQDVVIGCEEDVEAFVGQVTGILVRGRETGITLVGGTGQGKFQVGDGDIGSGDQRLYILQKGGEVEGPVRAAGFFDLFAVEHDVSGNGDGNRIRPAPERPGKGNLGRQNLHKQEKEAGKAVSKIQTVAISHIQIYTFILSRWINSLILYDFGYIPL